MRSLETSVSRKRKAMNRRLFLGGIAGVAVGGGILSGVTSVFSRGDYDAILSGQLNPPADGDPRSLINYATLAANSHNTQPWRFRIRPDGIEIVPDTSRRTPVVDSDDHHLFASLGCAAENMAIAARHFGRSVEVVAPPDGDRGVLVAFTGATSVTEPLFGAITQRQCTRAAYDGTTVGSDDLDELTRATAVDSVEAIVVTEPALRERVLELVLSGNRRQLEDATFRAELKSWLRFNPSAAARSRDGLWSAASGNPTLPDWLGPIMYDLAVKPDGDNDRVAAEIRSSAGLLVLSAGRNDPAGWVAAGRAYERFALAATQAGLKHAFINQAVEVAAVRSELQALLGIGDRRADLIVRFGRGPEMPRSLRRPIDDVIIA